MSSFKFKLLFVLSVFYCLNLSAIYAGSYAKNGIVYILLNDAFDSSKTNCVSDLPGVWRLSDQNGEPYTPWKLYSNVTSARGLSVNQEKATSVFFLNTSKGTLSPMSPGSLPDIDPSDDTCPLWVSVAEPTESGMAGTWQYAFSSASNKTVSGAYAKGRSAHVYDSVNYRYWYNEPSAYGGASYDFIVRFNGPNGVKYFNGMNNKDGLGTPMWKGPNSGEIRHTDYNVPNTFGYRKIILPSHFAAVGRFLYATKFNKTFAKGTEMNGDNGTTAIFYTQANKMGNAWDAMLSPGDIQNKALSRTNNNTYALQRSSSYKHPYFGCVVKMIYSQRTNTLDLKRGIDNTNNTWPSLQSVSTIGNAPNGTGLLETTDYAAVKYLGKWCGDSCIPGGDLDAEQQTPIKNEINVVTTTTGNVYGFNPKGSESATDKKAMLRFVKLLVGESHGAINIKNFNNFKNKNYLTGKGNVSDLKNIGVSSDFSSSSVYDYIYGSFADRFVVQDSWWGLGGIAYEYDKSTKQVTKLDYMNSTDGKPVTTDDCGVLYGNIDAIGVDGDAYLYALKTDGEPRDNNCKTPGLSADLSSSGYYTIGGYSTYVTVSGWRRSSDGEGSSSYSSIANGKQKSGDWREVKIQQKVYKSVYRYKEGQSLSYDTDLRGRLHIGYDYWVGYITCRGSYNTIGTFGYLGDGKIRAADLHAELAVVNVADSPVTFEGSPNHYVVVQDSDMRSGDKIQEEGKLTFKIEGLRPRYAGVTRSFKDMGVISLSGNTPYRIYVNNVHNNTTGEMTHDENHDGVYSGFPSTMFESAVKPTTVTWYIYQVDEKTAKPIIPSTLATAKIVKKLVDGTTVSSKNGSGLCSVDYTFKQPGRYIVQARIMYYLFSNYGDALRPTDLNPVSTTVYTQPFLVNVYASDLKYNTSPSYITNITMDFNPGPRTKEQLRSDYAGISTSAPKSGFDMETAEGEGTKNKNHFGDIRIEFDAEFFGLKENETGKGFQTYDGIGVWDYDYYQAIYKRMNSYYGIGVLTDSKVLLSSLNSTKNLYSNGKYNVYNFINGSAANVTSINDNSYNTNYNPGFSREFSDSSKDYRAGTEATGEIYDIDKSYIQYVLYLRDLPDFSTPSNPGKDTNPVAYTPQQEISRSLLNRGKVIASGTIIDNNLGNKTFESINDSRDINRKYHVGFTIKNIDSTIFVPRDPKEYVIDLELIYPRVYWKLDEEKEGSTSRVYTSSLVPYNSLTADAAPVHVLSNLNMTKGTNNLFNQSSLTRANSSDLSIGSFTLCVRDSVNPTPFYGYEKADYFSDAIDKNELKSNYMIYESTGDELATGSFYYGVEDNNPFMRFSRDINPKGIVATDTAKTNGVQVYRQILQENNVVFDKNDSRYEGSKKYTKTDGKDKDVKVRYSSYNNPKFYEKGSSDSGDNWKLYVTYHENVSEVSACSPKGLSKSYTLMRPNDLDSGDWSKYPCNIFPENWIGTLNYAIYGSVYDGYGTGNTEITHYIYSDNAANLNNGYPKHNNKDELLLVEDISYLERFDNDPPSIGLEVISQNDSAKWNIELIEDVNDPKSFGEDEKGLAKSKFKSQQFDLKGNLIPNSENTGEFDGTTNVYQAKTGAKPSSGEAKPKDGYIAEYTNPIMTFKKSSRLIINVDIFDNCGFLDLKEAWLEVKYGNTILLEKTDLTNLASSHDALGNIKKEFKLKPRETFVVDLPSHITDDTVTFDVYAKDDMGNERQLRVHGLLQETSFDARVIEHSESRK